MKEHEEGYSMPLAAPTFTEPPFYATPDSKILMMAYRADPDAVAFEVPEPLEPVEPNLVLAWLGDMGQPTHSVELYHECLTGIMVRYKEWTGWYINYIWVDNDMALTFEREIYGWPANMCDTTPLTFHGSQAIGHCHRAGECLMRLSMNVTSPPPIRRADSSIEDRFAELVDADFLQIRKIPNPEEGGKPIKQLLLIRPEDFALHEIWTGPGHLELGRSGLYPHLHKLEPVEILETWYLKASWVVPYPKVIWDNGQPNLRASSTGRRARIAVSPRHLVRDRTDIVGQASFGQRPQIAGTTGSSTSKS